MPASEPARGLAAAALRVVAAIIELIAIGFFAGAIAAFLVAFARSAHLVAPTTAGAAIAVSVLAASLAGLLALWRAHAVFGAAWKAALGLARPERLVSWRLGLALLLGLGVQVVWVLALSRATGIPIRLRLPQEGLLVFALWLVVLGPLSEEILFRGLCDARLRRVSPGWFAVAATAALFVASHADGGWARPLSVLPLALMLGALRRTTRSLWPGLVLHVLNNALVLAHSLAA